MAENDHDSDFGGTVWDPGTPSPFDLGAQAAERARQRELEDQAIHARMNDERNLEEMQRANVNRATTNSNYDLGAELVGGFFRWISGK